MKNDHSLAHESSKCIAQLPNYKIVTVSIRSSQIYQVVGVCVIIPSWNYLMEFNMLSSWTTNENALILFSCLIPQNSKSDLYILKLFFVDVLRGHRDLTYIIEVNFNRTLLPELFQQLQIWHFQLKEQNTVIVPTKRISLYTSINRVEGPPSCSFSITRLRVAATRFSRLVLSLAEIPVMIRSISIVPLARSQCQRLTSQKNQLDTWKRKRTEEKQNDRKCFPTSGMICCWLLQCNFQQSKCFCHISNFNLWIVSNSTIPSYNPQLYPLLIVQNKVYSKDSAYPFWKSHAS